MSNLSTLKAKLEALETELEPKNKRRWELEALIEEEANRLLLESGVLREIKWVCKRNERFPGNFKFFLYARDESYTPAEIFDRFDGHHDTLSLPNFSIHGNDGELTLTLKQGSPENIVAFQKKMGLTVDYGMLLGIMHEAEAVVALLRPLVKE